MAFIRTFAWKALTSLALCAVSCRSSPEAVQTDSAPTSSASSLASAWAPVPRPGCARSGPLVGIESDPSCVVATASEELTRTAMKSLTVDLEPDVREIAAGATVLVRLTLTNRASSGDQEIVFTAQPSAGVPRPDWARLAGVPELRQTASEGYRLVVAVHTLDKDGRAVDGLPTKTPPATTPRLFRVRLRPGAKLTHTFSWWARRIPAPMPVFHNDAGHRVVPKTAPVPLPVGQYAIAVDLPLYGLPPAESTFTTRIHVTKAEASNEEP